MARFSNVNLTCATSSAINFDMTEVWKLAGWTVVRSSDGTTYNASGDQISHSGTGAGGFGNNGAFRIMRSPNLVEQICIQGNGNTATNANNTRILYSAAAGFTGGTPGAVRVPTATDQQFILGGGTDASPTYGAWSAQTSVRVHICAENTPISGIYPVSMVGTQLSSTSQAGACFIMEPMMPGSIPTDNTGSPVLFGFSAATAITWSGWYSFGTVNATWVAAWTANNAPYDGTVGPDTVTGNGINGYAEMSATAVGAKRIKGICTRTAFRGPARAYPSTSNRATDARLYWGSYVVLFQNATEPSVA